MLQYSHWTPIAVEVARRRVHELGEVGGAGHQVGDPDAAAERRQLAEALGRGPAGSAPRRPRTRSPARPGLRARGRRGARSSASASPAGRPGAARPAVRKSQSTEASAGEGRVATRVARSGTTAMSATSPRQLAPVPTDRNVAGEVDPEGGVGEQRPPLQAGEELRRREVLAEHQPVVVGRLEAHRCDGVVAEPALGIGRRSSRPVGALLSHPLPRRSAKPAPLEHRDLREGAADEARSARMLRASAAVRPVEQRGRGRLGVRRGSHRRRRRRIRSAPPPPSSSTTSSASGAPGPSPQGRPRTARPPLPRRAAADRPGGRARRQAGDARSAPATWGRRPQGRPRPR